MTELFRIDKNMIKDSESQVFCAEGHSVVVHRDGETYYAFENRCPHKNYEIITGPIKSGTITCPWHKFKYDLKTGTCLSTSRLALKIYETKCENEELVIFHQEQL